MFPLRNRCLQASLSTPQVEVVRAEITRSPTAEAEDKQESCVNWRREKQFKSRDRRALEHGSSHCQYCFSLGNALEQNGKDKCFDHKCDHYFGGDVFQLRLKFIIVSVAMTFFLLGFTIGFNIIKWNEIYISGW